MNQIIKKIGPKIPAADALPEAVRSNKIFDQRSVERI
jgi:hypothetical protein